jgi:GNAT superfamily N-acetyltransferase
MAGHTTQELRAIVRESLVVPSPLEEYRATPGRRVEHGDLALFASGIPGVEFNLMCVFGPAGPASAFSLADAFFAGAGGYSVAVEVEAAGPIEEALRRRGWRLVEEEPALVLPQLPDAAPPAPAELDIRRVTDAEGYARYLAITATSPHHLPSLAAALDARVGLFVGMVDGQPVATSRLVRLGRIAELTGVVTLPAHRRRGYATAMTWAAIMAGAAGGCTVATLTATAMGYPVYVQMGFVPVCTLRTYEPPSTGTALDGGEA